MPIVRSERYPNLVVSDLGIQFRDGEVEVTDDQQLARLRELASMGVVVPEDVKPKPATRARK